MMLSSTTFNLNKRKDDDNGKYNCAKCFKAARVKNFISWIPACWIGDCYYSSELYPEHDFHLSVAGLDNRAGVFCRSNIEFRVAASI